MSQYDEQQVYEPEALYSEGRSAIRWPYYANLIVWVLVLAAGIWMTSVNPSMSFVPAIGTVGDLASPQL